MNTVDIRFYLAILVRRLPVVVATFVICALLGLTVALLMPPVYRASTRILVEAPQITSGIARGDAPGDAIAQLQAIEQQLVARSSILALAERFDIYGGKPMRSLDDIVDDMRARIKIDEVQFSGLQGGAGATAFSVTFDAQNPVLAAGVVNEIAASIVDRNMRLRTGRASDTFRFFDGETDRLGKELSRMEERILRFTNENRDALPDSLDFRRNRQASQQERLVQLQREEADLRNRRSGLLKLGESGGERLDGRSPKDQRLADLQQLLEARRAVFATSSPSVASVQARIDALRKGEAAEGTAAASRRPSSELGLQVADIDSRIAYIAEEKGAIGTELAALETSIQATPNNAAALNTLTRDYDNVKAQYNAATGRRADASSIEQIERLSKGQKLTIIERAAPPVHPAKPRRALIAALAAFGGIALGLALVLLVEMSNRSVRRPLDLVRTLGIQPLATIPFVPTPWEIVRGRLALAATLAGLAAVPVGLWNVAGRYPDHVDRLVTALLGSLHIV